TMGLLKEFKEFALKGNIVDLAVADIIGGAFGKIVTALTQTIIMPIISLILGKASVLDMSVTIGKAVFPIGIFLQAIIDFILIAFVLFMLIKLMNKAMQKKDAGPAPTPEEILLLREIRDAVRK